MGRGWLVSLGLAATVLCSAVVVQAARTHTPTAAAADGAEAQADPCFRYGRFECCVRPED